MPFIANPIMISEPWSGFAENNCIPTMLYLLNYIPHYFDHMIYPIIGVDSSAPLIQWFWEVMEEFSNQERSLFLRFVWGRTRLPRTIADFRGRDFVVQVLDKYNPPDHFLPESYTCFFLLKMPRYSCKVSILK